MKQNYCGKSWEHGTDIQKLIDAGVEVYWRKCWWTPFPEHEEQKDLSEPWQRCKSETDYLFPEEFKYRKINPIYNKRLVAYAEISYRIPDELYPVLLAREKAEKEEQKRQFDEFCEKHKDDGTTRDTLYLMNHYDPYEWHRFPQVVDFISREESY